MKYRLFFLVLSVCIVAVDIPGSAAAEWGCAAEGPDCMFGLNWAMPTRQAAEAQLLERCESALEEDERPGECRIVACRRNIDSLEQAQSLIPAYARGEENAAAWCFE